ncbi:MAG: 1,4-dihydroxy-6-naphthoate synthase [Proteobacteria bacterium]|nr:1,4-dihydroxy-6-naphthoate synthase [Desulfobulbaceae bacterium]MBU4152496.1 1,4-dihydroxy-6-naphthoate synthase [Pseudomonadota bacterium]
MTAQQPLSLGFSPCPNDTFIFHALVSGLIPTPGFLIQPPVLADVESLNQWAMKAKLDITKLSFHALGHVLDQYTLLMAGAALGRGCGPLLISRDEIDPSKLTKQTIAVPGHFTTAAMLLRLCYPECQTLIAMRFDQIMPAVAAGDVSAGVIIHESRFTYPRYGLRLVTDLGSWWEKTTGHPIPLGGIAVRRSLGHKLIAALETAIRNSLRSAHANPAQASLYIRNHAQEIDDQVTANHIALYVNDFSLDLGQEGIAAVRDFLTRGFNAGIFPHSPRL